MGTPTSTHMLVKSNEKDGEGENEKIRRKGERISYGQKWRMTLKTKAKN